MSSTFVSTQAVSTATRLSILKMQAELTKANSEASSGRAADVGLAAGPRTGQTISLRQDLSRLDALKDANGTASARLDATQAALDGMIADGQSFLQNLIAVRRGSNAKTVIGPDAADKLSALIRGLDTTTSGQYVFAGINTDVKPVADYVSTPASAAKSAIDAAFVAAFGTTQTGAGVGAISASAMQSFLGGPFSGLYGAASWTANWSGASSQAIQSRVSPTDVIATSISANEPAFRDLAKAYTMVTDLGAVNLSDAAYQTVIDGAIAAVSQGLDELTDAGARVGQAQARLKDADTRIDAQKDILTRHIDSIETVDPYDASTRVNSLTTQLELSYKITAQMQQLSLLNYL
jgi:flagellar hook-associated protein 3 FlgL